MSNLAEQLRQELTERAKNSESCKKYLLDWVMNQFRNGINPVVIRCTKYDYASCFSNDLKKRINYNERNQDFIHICYEDGKHFVETKNTKIDITDLPDAQKYAVDGKDISDKMLFLKDAGFKVLKCWKYGSGDIIEITY